MEFGLREWLMVIGIIVIAGILFDGWRRMRGSKGKLKFKLDRSFSNLPDDDSDPDLLSPPRVVDRSHEPAFDEEDLPSLSARELNRRRLGEPQQGDLNLGLEEPVPTLLNPGDDEVASPAAISSKPKQRQQQGPAAGRRSAGDQCDCAR